jgi:hypothetical protein
LAILGFAGVTAIDDNVALVTVRLVVPVMEPDAAWIIEEPAEMAVARPVEAMVATEGVADDQTTLLVRFWVLPSLNVPVAVNCCVAFLITAGLAGVTTRDFNVAATTVKDIEDVKPPDAAVMALLPADFALTSPAAFIVATAVFCEVHATLVVMSWVEPSLKCPVAANC